MSDMDRRAFVGSAAVGGVAAAVLAASSAMAAGQSGYFVIAEIVSKKDKADDLRALLVPFAEKSAKEPGCLVYTLMEVIGEPGRFLTFERWTDKAALDGHMVTPEIKAIVPKLEPFWRSRSLSFSSTRERAAKQKACGISPNGGALLPQRPGTTLDR
jgi:quinol monooxygenase YgiN